MTQSKRTKVTAPPPAPTPTGLSASLALLTYQPTPNGPEFHVYLGDPEDTMEDMVAVGTELGNKTPNMAFRVVQAESLNVVAPREGDEEPTPAGATA